MSQVRTMILRYIDLLPSLDGWILTGGRINAFKAMSSLWQPAGFTATATSSTQISVKWTTRATDANGYEIERKTEGGSYSIIKTTDAITNSLSDSGLKDGTRYFYRIRPFNDINKTPDQPGNETSTVTPLIPPTELKATAISGSQVTLTWKDNSDSEDGYEIERRALDGKFAKVGQVTQNITTFIDSDGLSPSKKYEYRVRAFNAVADPSGYSEQVTVKTLNSEGTVEHSGGGGGCSIGARQNTTTAVADMTIMLLPLIFIAIARRRK